MEFLASVGNLLITAHPFTEMLMPFLAGFAFFAASQREEKQGFWLRLGLFSFFVWIGSWLVFNLLVQPSFATHVKPWPISELFLSLPFFAVGAATYFIWLRVGEPLVNSGAVLITKKTRLERNKKTDVRNIEDYLPPIPAAYDPTKYFKKDAFFLGLGEGEKPIYYEGKTLKHVQVLGTTGAGKGVALGMLAAQCLSADEAVFWCDPKNDEFGALVLAQAAKAAGKAFHLVDLRPTAPPQINLFESSTAEQIEELFLAGFSLSEKGTESDFYTIDDRWAASQVAEDYTPGDTPASLLARHSGLEQTAKKFYGLLREMAQVKPVNANTGLNLRKIIEQGGAVYVIGSMRNAKVIRMQRMLLVKIIQLCEERDRNTTEKPRSVCSILDEAKYHISKPFLEGLGAARDKGLHIILAHQSQADLRDCPADLNADAVLGAVMENCSLKIVYRVEDHTTAEWMARKSGRILVDDETRKVSKNAAQAEIVSDERQIRQAERFLMDENIILNLKYTQAVVFGSGLPKFISTSPIQVKKSAEIYKIKGVAGDNIIKAAELI